MIAAKQSKAGNVSLSVAALPPVVNEIFEISRFSYVVTIFENLKDAVGAVSDDALTAFNAG
jgi:anti-anti-sigma regulatory factor